MNGRNWFVGGFPFLHSLGCEVMNDEQPAKQIIHSWSGAKKSSLKLEWRGLNLEKPNPSKGTDQRELIKVPPFQLLPAAECK